MAVNLCAETKCVNGVSRLKASRNFVPWSDRSTIEVSFHNIA